VAALILSREGLTLAEIPLGQAPITIGRQPGNLVRINSQAFADCHAIVAFEGGGYFLADQGSGRGTRLNGSPVSRASLAPGDRIGIGKYQFEFIGEAPPASLRILEGEHAGRTLVLVKERTTLGRTGRAVAAILRRSGGYFLVREPGEVAPVLNGQVMEGAEHALANGDMIRVAGVGMVFTVGGGSPDAPPMIRQQEKRQ